MRINLDGLAVETIHDEENNLLDVLFIGCESKINMPAMTAYELEELIAFLVAEKERLDND